MSIEHILWRFLRKYAVCHGLVVLLKAPVGLCNKTITIIHLPTPEKKTIFGSINEKRRNYNF